MLIKILHKVHHKNCTPSVVKTNLINPSRRTIGKAQRVLLNVRTESVMSHHLFSASVTECQDRITHDVSFVSASVTECKDRITHEHQLFSASVTECKNRITHDV